jgi:hypothetical protein
LPLFFLLSPANAHDAPFAKPLLAWAVQLYRIRPRVIRLDAAYWGLRLIAWIHSVLGAIAVIPWNPKRQKNRFCLPPTWTKEELEAVRNGQGSQGKCGRMKRKRAKEACSRDGW